jgi:hypothetical protein
VLIGEEDLGQGERTDLSDSGRLSPGECLLLLQPEDLFPNLVGTSSRVGLKEQRRRVATIRLTSDAAHTVARPPTTADWSARTCASAHKRKADLVLRPAGRGRKSVSNGFSHFACPRLWVISLAISQPEGSSDAPGVAVQSSGVVNGESLRSSFDDAATKLPPYSSPSVSRRMAVTKACASGVAPLRCSHLSSRKASCSERRGLSR